MAQKTDLNVSPYYDDFDTNDNFHRVLFRPGFCSSKNRELTTLQSILQNQVERHGQNIFKDGTVIIPAKYPYQMHTLQYNLHHIWWRRCCRSQYLNNTCITGATSGVKAKVIGFEDGTSTTQPILYIQYIEAGSDNTTQVLVIQKI